jgi:hypothetical protein
MLEKGLRVDAVMVEGSNFRYPLMYTLINYSEAELVRLLVSHGHSVNTPICIMADEEEHQVTPLMHAISCR